MDHSLSWSDGNQEWTKRDFDPFFASGLNTSSTRSDALVLRC